MFVNPQLKTSMTGNDWLMISSTFWSLRWQSLKITKICFLRRLDWNFCPAYIATTCKKSDSSSNCTVLLQINIGGFLVSFSSEEKLGYKALGWMLSFSWPFMWLWKQYKWRKSWILWLLLWIDDLLSSWSDLHPLNVNSFITQDPATYEFTG